LHVTHQSAPHETLVVRDRGLEAQILALCDQRRVAVLPGGHNKLAFALSALAGIVALGALLYWYTPAIARWTARRIPVEHERMLGTQMTALLEHMSCEDEAAEGVLAMLAGKLSAPLGKTPELEYEVRIMKSEGENAFALPGGTIMMTSGFLRGAKSDSEIAGVLAHEIEHVAQRHVLAGFLRDAVLSALWAVALGDYAGLMVVDPTTAYRIATLEFSRADEEEADRGAIARLHRASLRHTGLIAFFERAKKEHGDDDGLTWLSTHPSHTERIARLQKTPDVPEASAKRALSEAQLQALRAACQDTPPDKPLEEK
jgi:predicted Zn-dependent protease